MSVWPVFNSCVNHLRSLSCQLPAQRAEYPFALPFVETVDGREFRAPLVFLVGENGSGKSTFLEALAIASKRIVIGREDLAQDRSLDAVRPFASALKLSWSKRTHHGFFLRAEDFFGFIKRNKALEQELQGFADRFKDDAMARGSMLASKQAVNARYGRDLNDYSHGEGFLAFFRSRIVPNGLYLIDEPEAALSPQRQLAFALFLRDMCDERCQFVVATHSPIILSVPGAQIWTFGESGITESTYEELEHVRFMRTFMQSPERYWGHLLEE